MLVHQDWFAAYSSAFRLVVKWVKYQDNVITNDELQQQFSPLSHVVLLTFTDSESFDTVLGAVRILREQGTGAPIRVKQSNRNDDRQVRGSSSEPKTGRI